MAECGSHGQGAEAIAQARLLTLEGREGASGIAPDLQWETTDTAGGLADIIHYNHSAATQQGVAMQIYELKVAGSQPRAKTIGQLQGYVERWRRIIGQSNVRPGGWSDMDANGGFQDFFNVKLGQCDPIDDWPVGFEQNQQWHTFPDPSPGVLWVRPELKRNCETGEWDRVKGSGLDPRAFEGNDAPEEEAGDGRDCGFFCIFPWGLLGPRGRVPNIGRIPALLFSEAVPGQGMLSTGASSGAPFDGRSISGTIGVSNRRPAPATGGESMSIIAAEVDTTLRQTFYAGSFGDPHMVTLDSLGYDLPVVGEFQAVYAPSEGVNMQVRYAASTDDISSFNALATEINGHRVQLTPWSDTPVIIDDATVDIPIEGFTELGEGAFLLRSDTNTFMVAWPSNRTGDQTIAVAERHGLKVHVPRGVPTSGLYGNNDGDPTNDLAYASGQVLPLNPGPALLAGDYADSWRVTNETSLFHYDLGETTASYTDKAYPQGGIKTLTSFTAAERSWARNTCASSGVMPGYNLDSCALDVLVSGDSRFIDVNKSAPAVIQAAAESAPESDGMLRVTFDQPEPVNVAPSGSVPDPAGGAFAGPFTSSGGYSAHVYGPVHESYELEFDLITLGDWTTAGTEAVVHLKTVKDGGDFWTTTLSRDANGALASSAARWAPPRAPGSWLTAGTLRSTR
jgi:hypothetical protein